jgi:hypothetical protein
MVITTSNDMQLSAKDLFMITNECKNLESSAQSHLYCLRNQKPIVTAVERTYVYRTDTISRRVVLHMKANEQ